MRSIPSILIYTIYDLWIKKSHTLRNSLSRLAWLPFANDECFNNLTKENQQSMV